MIGRGEAVGVCERQECCGDPFRLRPFFSQDCFPKRFTRGLELHGRMRERLLSRGRDSEPITIQRS